MNPHASTNCAGRLFMALAAIASISLMAACGNSPFTPPNQVGFNNGSLNGTYVFSSSGVDGNGNPLALAGTFVANGNGGNSGITGGTMDVIDPSLDVAPSVPPSPAAQSITSGSYQVGGDGRGQVSLTSTYGTFVLDFVLTSTSGGLVTEFDANGTGSGTLDLQTPVTSLSQLAGPYAFSLAGTDSGDDPLAAAGAFTLNSSGTTSTPGVEDINEAGVFLYPKESLTAAITSLGSGTGPGAINLSTETAFGSPAFDFYAIDATHLKFIETDYAEFISGDAFTQTGASIPNGAMVFTMAGGTSATPIADGGLMTSDGTGNFPTGLEDINYAGTVPAEQGQFAGGLDSEASGPAGTGRVFVNLIGFSPNIENAGNWVIYPIATPVGSAILMLEMDTASVTAGVGYAQTGTSFTVPGNYGLNLSGENAADGESGEVDDIAQFNATTAVAPATNMTGTLDENSLIGGTLSAPLNPGVYTPDSPATGRGSIIADTTGTVIGGISLEYYTINSSTALFIEVDSDQVAAGTFEVQTPPGGDAAVARPHLAVVHPVVHPHAAKKSKWAPAASRK
jgi:hypothetical protein